MSQTPVKPTETPVADTPIIAKEGDHQYDQRFLNRVVEGAILANAQALSIDKILSLFDEDKRPSRKQLMQTLADIRDNQHDRGFVLKEVASGWRFEVCDDLAPWVNRLWDEKPQKYSRALLETLSLVTYRQPLTRGDIEDVRGVAVSSNIIKTLIERDWVKVVGHRDVPGRPALYATTRSFLDYFGLKSLEQLPSLGELQDIESISAKLGLDDSTGLNANKSDKLTAGNPAVSSGDTIGVERSLNDGGLLDELNASPPGQSLVESTTQTHFDQDIAHQQSDATTLSAADSTEPLKKTEV